jgi:hypothetical protein
MIDSILVGMSIVGMGFLLVILGETMFPGDLTSLEIDILLVEHIILKLAIISGIPMFPTEIPLELPLSYSIRSSNIFKSAYVLEGIPLGACMVLEEEMFLGVIFSLGEINLWGGILLRINTPHETIIWGDLKVHLWFTIFFILLPKSNFQHSS